MKNKNNKELKAYYNKARDNWFVRLPIKNPNTNEIKIHKKYFATLEEANEEIKQFQYKSANKIYKEEPLKNVFLMQMYMGVRIGEALALKKEDFDFEENMLHIKRTLKVDDSKQIYVGDTTKSPAGVRDIPISDKISESLKEQIDNFKENKYDLLFINERGRIVNPRNANSILKRIVLHTLKTDDISTHSLRHTFGTRCIEAGMSPVAVQKLMGHEDLSVTMNTYVSVLNKFKTDELKKLNSFYNKEAVFGNEKVSSSELER